MSHITPKLNGMLWLIFFIIISPTIAEKEGTFLDVILNPFLRLAKSGFGTIFHYTVNTRPNEMFLAKSNRTGRDLSNVKNFPCDLMYSKLRSDEIPTNAHEVRPGDIDIIAGMGDSLSAGTGISSAFITQELFSEERGRSWSIGGEGTWKTYLTLPNILKKFNPELFGYSLKSSQTFQWESQFNVAENGAISKNIPYMVKELVKRIKNDPRVDLNRHWKMVTLMIGDNDFCSEICYYSNPYDSLKNHKKDMLYVLRFLKNHLPRTIVNIVPPPSLEILPDLAFMCNFIHSFTCPCIEGLAFKNKKKVFDDVMKKWQQLDIEISNLPEFDKDEFTVIPHNFTVNYTFPTTSEGVADSGYLAPDCFHFSERGQARFANDLWISLLEPFGQKHRDGTDVLPTLRCPTDEHPYIFTRRNS